MTKMIQHFLPFYDERPVGACVRALVLHCSAHSAKDMIEVLKERELSAHYIIDTDGMVYQLVSEKKRAWHAGVSQWREMKMLNQYSIGIELSSLSLGQTEYSSAQLKSLVHLSRQIIRHYQIPHCNVVAHSDIAPTRKPDPGMMFPWQYLARKGIGCWYDITDADKVVENDVAVLLSSIGYDVQDLAAAGYAFCRHFLPSAVDLDDNINHLIDNVYPKDFVFPEEFLPILRACAYRYSRS